MATLSTEYTWEEIAKHDNASSLWIVFDGKVYDVTKFVEEVKLAHVARGPTIKEC